MKDRVLADPISASWRACSNCNVTLFGGMLKCRHCGTWLPVSGQWRAMRIGLVLIALVTAVALGLAKSS